MNFKNHIKYLYDMSKKIDIYQVGNCKLKVIDIVF